MKLLKLEMTQLVGHIMKNYVKYTIILEAEELGLQHCAPLIKSVLNVFDMHIDELPSESTAANFSHEMSFIAKQHVDEAI